MNINLAMKRMGLNGFNKFLLQKKINVSFPVTKLMYPQLSWEKHGYTGTLTVNELKQHVFDAYNREKSSLDKYKHQTITLIDLRIERIDEALTLADTVEKIQKMVEEKWYNRSVLSSMSYYAFGFSDYFRDQTSFDGLTQELKNSKDDLLKSKEKILRQQQKSTKPRTMGGESQRKSYSYTYKPANTGFTFKVFSSDNSDETDSDSSFNQEDFFKAFFGNNFFQQNYSRPSFSYSYSQPQRGYSYNAPPMPQRKSQEDPYTVLGLQRNASTAEIKKRYHSLAMKYHPDKNPNDPKAKDRFQKIQNAYEALTTE